ncbi:hypothetical protein HYH02_003893 [Chlamydomonas schloesseri]|uniref:CobW C-terminal domain-containing protein n=1 Tax=Chlamydomonas schloesseri TaxID=2026947 RepID=A0A835WP61_9CHLO|nr:hypothetical protein HYH02_003893 [Chlamydomonas schloesseri]|eukprot:KAG2451287.1 hypothetical protein HYH02_003893 [Chlamydomonas schloesseri]
MRRPEPAACEELRRVTTSQSAVALNSLEAQFARVVVLEPNVSSTRAGPPRRTNDGKQDFGINSLAEQQASASTAAPQHGATLDNLAGGISAVSVMAEGPLDEYRFNMFMNDLLSERRNDIVGFKGVLCVQGYGNTKFVIRGSREGLGYGPAEQEWSPQEPRINQLVFIGRGLDKEELSAGLRTCVHTPAPALTAPLPLWPSCMGMVLPQSQAWGAAV